MKKEYNSPEAEIDFFNILSSVCTESGFGFETEDSEEKPWG